MLALAMVLAGLFIAPLAAAQPSKPELAKSSLVWPDGLNHFILTPSSVLPKKVTVSKLDELPPGAVLTHSPDGKAVALLADGRLVPIGTEVASAEDAPAKLLTGAGGREASEQLAISVSAWPDVKEAKGLGGGLVSIATPLHKDAFENRSEISRVDDDLLLEMTNVATGTPNDPSFSSQWMHKNTGASSQAGGYGGTVGADTRAPQAWSRATGSGVIVADVDSGVDYNHPDLAANIWHNTHEICGDGVDNDHNGYIDDCNGWDAANNDNDPMPDGGGSFGSHGTHVAGIIGATGDNNTGLVGMAPDARIMPVKISSGRNLSTSAIVGATIYAVDNGAKIINGSWGTSPGTPRGAAWPMEQAVSYAHDHGVLYVVAAGNSGVNIDNQQSWPASFSASYDNVLTVGASTNSDGAASFSNYGRTVDVFGPGWFINSTMPGNSYGLMSGTSMASPCVAGAVALVASSKPSLTAAQLKQRMKDTVDRVPALTGMSASDGRINAATAVGAGADAFNVEYTGLDHIATADSPWTMYANITAGDNTVASQTTQLKATVITSDSGGVYAVAGMGIGVMVGGNQWGVPTDENGSAMLEGVSLSAPTTVGLNLAMPAGNYAVMLQPAKADGTLLGNGSVVFFAIAPAPDNVSGGGQVGGGAPDNSGGSTGGGGSIGSPPSGGGNFLPPSNGGVGSGGFNPPSNGSGGSVQFPGGGSGGSIISQPPSGSVAPPSGGGNFLPPGANVPVGGGSSGGGSPGGSTGGGGFSPPPSGSGSAPPPDPQPVRANGWEITTVSPRSGDVAGGAMLVIRGIFLDPTHVTVLLGGQPAPILYAGTGTILARVLPHIAGTVDLTVQAPGTSLTMPQVFTYTSANTPVAGGGAAPGGGSGGSSTPPSTGGGSAGRGTGGSTGGGGSTSPTPVPPDPGTGAGGGSTGGGSTAPAGPLMRGGYRLMPISGNASLLALAGNAWPGANCSSASCRGAAVR